MCELKINLDRLLPKGYGYIINNMAIQGSMNYVEYHRQDVIKLATVIMYIRKTQEYLPVRNGKKIFLMDALSWGKFPKGLGGYDFCEKNLNAEVGSPVPYHFLFRAIFSSCAKSILVTPPSGGEPGHPEL